MNVHFYGLLCAFLHISKRVSKVWNKVHMMWWNEKWRLLMCVTSAKNATSAWEDFGMCTWADSVVILWTSNPQLSRSLVTLSSLKLILNSLVVLEFVLEFERAVGFDWHMVLPFTRFHLNLKFSSTLFLSRSFWTILLFEHQLNFMLARILSTSDRVIWLEHPLRTGIVNMPSNKP